MIIGKANYRKLPSWLSMIYSFVFLSWELLYDRLLFKKPLKVSKNRIPMLLTADLTSCAECNQCIELCPEFALSIVNNEMILDQMSCSYCEYCVTVCEKGKIELQEVDFHYLDADQRFTNLTAVVKDEGSES